LKDGTYCDKADTLRSPTPSASALTKPKLFAGGHVRGSKHLARASLKPWALTLQSG
jgi:hypothetical protein